MTSEARRPKILLAPMNMAHMPVTIAKALRARGYEAAHIQYTIDGKSPLGYELDRVAETGGRKGRIQAQMGTLKGALDEGFDIFHFWNRSLTYRTDYGAISGIDMPLIKARGRRIAYRFTGYDLRLPSRDLAANPYSPFRYEQPALYDEDRVKAYQDMLREYVDRFFVQDPEMAQFWPDATIIPRALDLDDWAYVGVQKTDRPLIVHAPTNPEAKGSRFVLAAIEALKAEGLAFDFKLLRGVPHGQARQIFRAADIVVDQLLSGATGVTTLEAWALGKPVVSNLRQDLFGPFYGMNDLPVAYANPDIITATLRDVIKDFDRRQDLATRGRALVEERHDVRNVIDNYIAAYEDIFASPPIQPTGDGDLRYFAMQMEITEAGEGFLARWRRSYRDALRQERSLARLRDESAGGALKLYWRAIKPLVKRDLKWVRRLFRR